MAHPGYWSTGKRRVIHPQHVTLMDSGSEEESSSEGPGPDKRRRLSATRHRMSNGLSCLCCCESIYIYIIYKSICPYIYIYMYGGSSFFLCSSTVVPLLRRQRCPSWQTLQGCRLPQVPPPLQGLFERTEEPESHGGRKRRVPHVEGNYPTLAARSGKPRQSLLGFAMFNSCRGSRTCPAKDV